MMTSEHFSLASEMIREITKVCRAIEILSAEEPVRAAKVARELREALRPAHTKLAKVKLPPVRATRWQGITRANVSFIRASTGETT